MIKFFLKITFISRRNFFLFVTFNFFLKHKSDKFFNVFSQSINNGPSNKFIFRATYGNSIVCNIFPA
jgi:hypothetical protein